MTSKVTLYLINIFLIILTGYHILPNLSLDKDEFHKVSGLISSVRKEGVDSARKKVKLFNNIKRERLIITIADSQYHEYYVSDIYESYWPKLFIKGKRGREIVLYIGKEKEKEDPFRIEIEGEVIYGTDIRFKRNLLILIFTIVLTLYNLYRYFKPDQLKGDLLQLGDRFSSVKDYFLNNKN